MKAAASLVVHELGLLRPDDLEEDLDFRGMGI